MRKWGIVVSLIYALLVLGLIVPAAIFLGGDKGPLTPGFYKDVVDAYKEVWMWIPIAVVLCGQAILLFVSVDTSQKRLKPRTHIVVSCIVAAMLFGLLTFAVLFCVGVAVYSDKFFDMLPDNGAFFLSLWVIPWALWAIFFYLYLRNSTQVITRAMSWLLKGSVLELLIAVPCHVIVRRRQDCSAPVATSFGIASGVAVMLLCFGPSVLLLFKKRLEAYTTPKSTKEQSA